MAYFGGAGVGRPETGKEARARAAAQALEERAHIAKLSAADVAKIMARVLVTRCREANSVERSDFLRAGIPDARIDPSLDTAFAVARHIEPGLDGMVAL